MWNKIVVPAALVLAIAGCGENSGQSELEKRNNELVQELAAKDRFIEDISSTIGEINNKLEDVWAMEKNIMGQTASLESGVKPTPAQMKEQILKRITEIQSTLQENRKQVSRLQRRLKDSNTKYAGLEKMLDDVKKNLEERELAIAEMQTRIQNLEGDISLKLQVINEHEATINEQARQLADQTKTINTAYYIAGSSDELRQKGIIAKEGGILWGLMGTTTVLASDLQDGEFKPLDKTAVTEIEVPGTIDEIVPKRDASMYVQEEKDNNHTVLKITDPAKFWKENKLVIVTDKPITVAQLEEE